MTKEEEEGRKKKVKRIGKKERKSVSETEKERERGVKGKEENE